MSHEALPGRVLFMVGAAIAIALAGCATLDAALDHPVAQLTRGTVTVPAR